MRSRQLQAALTDYVKAASGYLGGEVAAGAEVPFEVGSQLGGRAGRGATPLYCYRALTGQFIAEREPALRRLPGHAEAASALEAFEGLDRYLAGAGAETGRAKARSRARIGLRLLLEDAFQEQTDFELRPERMSAALARLERSAGADADRVTLLATLHGVTIASPEIQLAQGLSLARAEALADLPRQLVVDSDHPDGVPAGADGDVIVVYGAGGGELSSALARGQDVLADLLRALRLFGDARVNLGSLAWTQLAGGPWSPLALGTGGRPHGMLVVTAEQEDELRAFCNLVSRRAPQGSELAWALRRYELGCERERAEEALTDHLLALRVLLEPEGPSSGLLPGRLAALCAAPTERERLSEQMLSALALERDVIAGASVKPAAVERLERQVAGHLRALLSDVICGHLDPELAPLADQLLLAGAEEASGDPEPDGPAGERAAGEDSEGSEGREQAPPQPQADLAAG